MFITRRDKQPEPTEVWSAPLSSAPVTVSSGSTELGRNQNFSLGATTDQNRFSEDENCKTKQGVTEINILFHVRPFKPQVFSVLALF